MTDINETLAQRGSTYGDFREQGRITQNLKRAMQDSPNWSALPDYFREGLDMIQHKVSRILNGDPFYDDNIHDMIGYSKLIQDRAAQDRAAGVKFVTTGDRLYPPYQHSGQDAAHPVPGGSVAVTEGAVAEWPVPMPMALMDASGDPSQATGRQVELEGVVTWAGDKRPLFEPYRWPNSVRPTESAQNMEQVMLHCRTKNEDSVLIGVDDLENLLFLIDHYKNGGK